jgi:demethylmenaquinone methyltransferase/2-methoxy-6-polyprenyl-1,4-benzoquinol methylase
MPRGPWAHAVELYPMTRSYDQPAPVPIVSSAADAASLAVDKSGGRVQGMFSEIAPRYDLVNRLLSGGIDVAWRRTTVRRAAPPAAGAVLDVCCGTGDLALAYAAVSGPEVRIVASDFCRPMLDRGVEKALRARRAIEWVEADAMQLPFASGTFDLVTVAFGLRNIADTARGLAEMARVTKPGGRLVILEFSLPTNRLVRAGYLWYFRRVLPWVGNVVARSRSDAYTYLNRSVEAFPSGAALASLVRAAGFDHIEMIPLTFGIATLSIARRATTEGAA